MLWNDRWYTAREVGTHCSTTDCWVTISGRVYNVTPLFADNPPVLCEPIIKNAGKDISQWFEPRTFNMDEEIGVEVLLWRHPTMKLSTYYTPQGRFAHIPPPFPRTDFNMDYNPWWLDKNFVIGFLSKRTQFIRVKNILLDHVYVMEVPCEETINEILYRYTEHNKHAASYEWKAILEYDTMKFCTMDMTKTLTENGVKDESQEFGCAGMQLDYLLPAIHLHYTDDLTVA
uniref:Cytochrome b5 domain-containing protein 1 n=1 Tax=Physcomitrium patens TaxID=3218 RepID=A0A2K1IMN9_PHYPA|nr:hypothetical protein PHYPA_026861 [Physcomitrium patens]